MRGITKAVLLSLFTVAGSVGVAVFEVGANLLVFLLWIAVCAVAVRHLNREPGRRFAVVTGGVQLVILAVIVTTAYLAPVKRIDAVLEKTVHLGRTTLTVAELSEYCESHREDFPLRVFVVSDGPGAESVLHFSDESMPLRQFVREVENQTGYSHHFNGCGMAYTILDGPAYNFGLSFTPPPKGNPR